MTNGTPQPPPIPSKAPKSSFEKARYDACVGCNRCAHVCSMRIDGALLEGKPLSAWPRDEKPNDTLRLPLDPIIANALTTMWEN